MKSKLNLLILTFMSAFSWAGSRIMLTIEPDPVQVGTMYSSESPNAVRQKLMQPLTKTQLEIFSGSAGVKLIDIGPLATGGRVVMTAKNLTPAEMQDVLAKLRHTPGIMSADADEIMHTNLKRISSDGMPKSSQPEVQ